MEVLNKTRRPLTVSLPGGKKLRLGPGKVGQIAPKDAAHPPVKKLIDEGDIEVLDAGLTKGTGGFRKTSSSSGGSTSGSAGGGVRHTGDR
jgi:hypothetical protein